MVMFKISALFGKYSLWMALAVLLSSCQFQPLYSQSGPVVSNSGIPHASVKVSEVTTRSAQLVRNHLIFLLSGGSTPSNPAYDVKLRVSSNTQTLASRVANSESNQLGNTAGSVQVTASYDVYELATGEVVFRGNRTARAAFDKTSQSFASERAELDAEKRAAVEVAEQVRLAIAAGLAKN